MKRLCLLLISIFLLCQGRAFAQDTTVQGQVLALQNAVKVLEGNKGNMDNAFQNKSKELDIQILQADTERDAVFWTVLFSAIGLAVTFLGGWRMAYHFLKGKAELHIEKQLQLRVDTRIGELVSVLDQNRRLKRFRKEKKIVMVCRDTERQLEMERLLKETFQFDQAKAIITVTYEKPPVCDLLLFDLEGLKIESVEGARGVTLVEEYIPKHPTQLKLYFGPQGSGLNPDQISFANTRITLLTRILEIFEYQEATKQG